MSLTGGVRGCALPAKLRFVGTQSAPECAVGSQRMTIVLVVIRLAGVLLGLLLLLAAAALLLGRVLRAHAPELAYISGEVSGSGITGTVYVLDVERGLSHRLIATGQERSVNSAPAWSPDGRWLAYIDPALRNNRIYLADASGGRRHMLSPAPGDQWSPVWSPGGERIAFSAAPRNGFPGVYVADAASGETLRLTPDDAFSFNATWSPDGMQLAYVRLYDSSATIYSVRLGTGLQPLEAPQMLVDNLTTVWSPSALSRFPVWSPRGDLLAFLAYVQGDLRVFTVRSDGSAPTPVDIQGTHWMPAWSPDGSQLAFVRQQEGATAEIYVVTTPGSSTPQLIANGTYFPVWSPDGQWIAYSSLTAGNWDLYLVPAAGGTARRLTSSAAADWFPAWRP